MRRLIWLVALCAAQTLPAQTISSSVTGTVSDPSGLAVPQARVTLTLVATGATRETTTNEQGTFLLTTLPPGEYKLTVTAGGFRTLEKRSINLSASETLPVGNLQLTIGGTAESVTVTAEGSVVQTASAERAGTITSDQVQNLLIKGRNVTDLLQLMPGVVSTSAESDALSAVFRLNVQGASQRANNMLMDGVPTNDNAWSLTTPMLVSMDSVSEVRILLTNYQAEYGRQSGPQIQMITKSGTRDFHGLGSYFKRHEQFNANNFFNNRNGVAKPLYRFNTWTYNVGGPVYIPNRMNRNRDKLFFFWSQEFWPVKVPAGLRYLTVPTELERQGDFSQSLDLNGRLIPITDPATRQPFPENRVPASRIDANGQALLKVFPAPNFPDRNISRGNYNYVPQEDVLDSPRHTDALKVDYNATPKDYLFLSMRYQSERESHFINSRTGGNDWPQLSRTYGVTGWVWSGHYQRIFSPSVVNELVIGYWSKPDADEIPDSELRKNQRDAVGFRTGQLYPDANPMNLIPNASFGGVTGAASLSAIDSRFPYWGEMWQLSISDNLTRTSGRHTVRGGFYFERARRTSTTTTSYNGSFSFGRDVNNPLDTNYAYSNALLGIFGSYTEASGHPSFDARFGAQAEWYLQDNWKVNKRLTLDYGLRFYWRPPFVENDGLLSGFFADRFENAKSVSLIRPALIDGRRSGVHPLTGQVYPAAAIGAIAPGLGDPANGMVVLRDDPSLPRSMMDNPGVLLAPRFGFSWDPFGKGKTAVRGGFGVYYDRPDVEVWTAMRVQTPLVETPTIYYGTLQNLLSSPGVVFPQSVQGLDVSSPATTMMNFSLSVQQDIGFGTVVDVGYVGSLGRHLMWARNLNPVPFGANFEPANADPASPSSPLPSNFLRPYMGYGDITLRENAGSSNYHSMQVTAKRRFAKGVQFGAAWTWSKAMTFADSETSGISPLVPIRNWNYGLAGFDRTHILKLDWIWEIPKAPWRDPFSRTVLHNWQLSGIGSFISGSPMSVGWSSTVATDITGTATQGARVDVIGNPVLPKSERTFDRFFRTDVFRMPARGTWGNSGKTLLRGPGVNNWDVAVFKNFPIHEQIAAQFRWEMYNAFNHTQFSGVNNTARFDAAGNQVNAALGQFTSARSPRIMQFALRLYF